VSEAREGFPPELPADHKLVRLCVDLVGKPPGTAPYGTDASELQAIAILELRLQQLLAHAMHADARKFVGHRGQRADHVEFTGAPHLVQRPGAVLAARPGDQGFRQGAAISRRHGVQFLSEQAPACPNAGSIANFMANSL